MIISLFHFLPEIGQILRRTRIFESVSKETPMGTLYDERYIKRLLWYLLGGTRGGPNRAEIIKTLQNRPCNANQLAEVLRVDYKTIQHHVRILQENGLVAVSDKGVYGAMLFLTPKMEEAFPVLEEIWGRIGRRKISSANPE